MLLCAQCTLLIGIDRGVDPNRRKWVALVIHLLLCRRAPCVHNCCWITFSQAATTVDASFVRLRYSHT